MPTFKVVLDGIELSDEDTQRIAASIQRAALDGLAGFDAASGRHLAQDRVAASIVPIFKGQTLGIWISPVEISGKSEKLIAREFGL